MTKCINCGASNKDSSSFCSDCGNELLNSRLSCPNCGKEVKLKDKSCKSCGVEIKDTGIVDKPGKSADTTLKKPLRKKRSKLKIALIVSGSIIGFVILVLLEL